MTLQEQTEDNLMVAISRAWFNGSYTMVAEPIKSLELHYTMTQFSIIHQLNVIFTNFRTLGSRFKKKYSFCCAKMSNMITTTTTTTIFIITPFSTIIVTYLEKLEV